MSISANQSFLTPFCRVKLYDTSKSGNKLFPAHHVEKWSKEIMKYISSVEAVLNRSQDGGLGSFTVMLSPDLSTMLAWLNNAEGRGEWLRIGGFISIQFGYIDGNDKTVEFMGTMQWPEIDLNPTSPTITIKGIIANGLLWEGFPPYHCYGQSPMDIIKYKAKQFNYNVEVSDRLKENFSSVYQYATILQSEGIETFVRNVIPLMIASDVLRDGKNQILSVISGENWKLDLAPKDKQQQAPKFIFRFMGRFNLQATPQVIAIDNLQLPFQWATFVPSAVTPSCESYIGDSKEKDRQIKQTDSKGSRVTCIAGDSYNAEAVRAQQSQIDEVKKRYLSYTAEIDTIGLPTLEVGDFIQFHNTGVIDTGLWQVYRAKHRWSAVGYRSSWSLHCINFEESFGKMVGESSAKLELNIG